MLIALPTVKADLEQAVVLAVRSAVHSDLVVLAQNGEKEEKSGSDWNKHAR